MSSGTYYNYRTLRQNEDVWSGSGRWSVEDEHEVEDEFGGFLCHSRVLASPSAICRYLDDNSCSALIILGFVMMSPLVVVAAATFCGLLRRFRLLLYFQPISGAWYRGRGFVWRRGLPCLGVTG
ncbi:hypothetical protein MHYP_G00265190 [Metynnis hypsauchen]